ncbi:alkene reductase [Arhodomonas aquaeolei]|uniref:alkene reductase n=1 Tax=Arhodomonas aquaeolei TaxID=2369 RepID=UPI00216704BE|nr:alkene reductase [Arhodomonas aquaeolei]MCS4505959.1 alkene reductase [Arhodomonas aquaeolei]
MQSSPRNPAVEPLFQPLRVGDVAVPNRIVMAPLTRNRAGGGNAPTELMARYYSQRAGAGLIVAEATQIRPDGQGYLYTPGIHSDEQVAGWRRVTDAVHEAGGRMALQLWHVGRISHTSLLNGEAPIAPSAIRAEAKTYTANGFEPVSEPRALEASEIPGLVADYARAAERARDAGFDLVEIHAANGYLIEQFLKDGANQRTDDYGGSIENRARLLFEVTDAIVEAVGAGRVGIRISPVTPANGISESDPTPLYEHVVDGLAARSLAYVHIIEGATGGDRGFQPFDYAALRRRFPGCWMANNGYTPAMAGEAVASGYADLVAFGRSFISNPDLVQRIALDAPMQKADSSTFYGGDERGYTDYPFMEQAATA